MTALSRGATGWQKLKAGTNDFDKYLHLPAAAILLGFSYVHLFKGFCAGVVWDWTAIAIIDVYLVALLALATLKVPKPLPARQVALVTFPALFLTLVLCFAHLYIANGNIKRLNDNNKDWDRASEPWDGAYFSLVTITTLGYGDFTPHETTSRRIVVVELFSGALFLFCALPLLISRLASFEETPGAQLILKVRHQQSGEWEVWKNGEGPQHYAKNERLTIRVAAQGEVDLYSSE